MAAPSQSMYLYPLLEDGQMNKQNMSQSKRMHSIQVLFVWILLPLIN